MCGVTKKDNIRNELVGGSVELAPVTKNIAEKMQVTRRMVDEPMPVTRMRGRHETSWKDYCKADTESVGAEVMGGTKRNLI